MPTIFDAVATHKKELVGQATTTVTNLVGAYETVTKALDTRITKLNSEILIAHTNGTLSVNKVRQLVVYQELLKQVEDEVSKFGVIADYETRKLSALAITTSGTHTQTLVTSMIREGYVWANLPSESIETLLGFLADDSPLHNNLLAKLGPTAVATFEDSFLSGIALGYNPNKTAGIIANSLAQPLSWVAQTVRTAQMYTYREASRANYAANGDVVEGWTWFATLGLRTCPACINNHGKFFKLDQRLNDHHNGRCLSLPKVFDEYAVVDQRVVSGEKWFNSLSQADQRTIMGPSKLDLYKTGRAKFEEFSTVYSNAIYGDMITEAKVGKR
jgi:hypothetical protein